MALYLGNKKQKIIVDNKIVNLIVPSVMEIFNGVKLLSFDKYTLTDKNGRILTAKEDK